MKNNYRFGFTLAEILVTIGIIGVVAAISMPSLVGNVQKKTYVTQLHKAYSDISNVVKKYLSDERVESFKETDLYAGVTSFEDFYEKYFNVAKYCGTGAGCFAEEYTDFLTGEASTFDINNSTGYEKVVLASGASIAWNKSKSGTSYSTLFVDVNGVKGPNQAGRDLFRMQLNHNAPNKLAGRLSDYCTRKSAGTNSARGLYCFAKIIEDNWEMNY